MFKEKRFVYREGFESSNGSGENHERIKNKRWEEVTPSVDKANKAIENAQKWAEKAKNLEVKMGENPTWELEEKYSELIKSLDDLNNGVENNVNELEFKNSLTNFNKNISSYEELTELTKNFVKDNEGEAARLQTMGKKSKEEIQKENEESEINIKKAEENIKKTIAEGGTSKQNKKQIEEAVNELASYLEANDPRREIKYWLTLAREEGKIDEWKAKYGGQEIANNNIDNLF